MNCKKMYIGQELTHEDWDYGIGSVYLAGPRNPKGKSWRVDLIQKLEESGCPICIFVPESKNQLKGGFSKVHHFDRYQWQHMVISLASTIVFWFPSGCSDAQSYVEFGAWHKAERIFLGQEDRDENDYLDWLMYKKQNINCVNSMDKLIEMVTHWLKE
jgi:hypothetical protein